MKYLTPRQLEIVAKLYCKRIGKNPDERLFFDNGEIIVYKEWMQVEYRHTIPRWEHVAQSVIKRYPNYKVIQEIIG